MGTTSSRKAGEGRQDRRPPPEPESARRRIRARRRTLGEGCLFWSEPRDTPERFLLVDPVAGSHGLRSASSFLTKAPVADALVRDFVPFLEKYRAFSEIMEDARCVPLHRMLSPPHLPHFAYTTLVHTRKCSLQLTHAYACN